MCCPGNIDSLVFVLSHESHYFQNVRFLRKDDKTESWSSVPLRQIRLKIAQRLRERAPLKKFEKLQAGMATTGPPAETMAPPTMVTEEPIIPSQIYLYNEGRTYLQESTVSRVQQQGKEVGIVTDSSSDEEASSLDDLSTFSEMQPKPNAVALFQEVFGMPFLPIKRQDIKQKRKQAHTSDCNFVPHKKQRTSSQSEGTSNAADDESILTFIDGDGMEDFELEGIALDDGNAISDYEYLEYLLST